MAKYEVLMAKLWANNEVREVKYEVLKTNFETHMTIFISLL
jgi:hypothetical protein